MEKLYTVSKNKTWNSCGSDHEVLIAKSRINLKKVGKTTRPFWYDLNQIPHDYTVEVKNRFKGLDLVDGILYRRQGPKLTQRKRNARRQSVLGGLTNR